jgi:hypothetical protein
VASANGHAAVVALLVAFGADQTVLIASYTTFYDDYFINYFYFILCFIHFALFFCV